MKKILVGLLLILLAINVQAQWYNIQYGVNNIKELSESQLTQALQQFEKNVRIGKTLFWAGICGELLDFGLGLCLLLSFVVLYSSSLVLYFQFEIV